MAGNERREILNVVPRKITTNCGANREQWLTNNEQNPAQGTNVNTFASAALAHDSNFCLQFIDVENRIGIGPNSAHDSSS